MLQKYLSNKCSYLLGVFVALKPKKDVGMALKEMFSRTRS